jgi:hypothetical protein
VTLRHTMTTVEEVAVVGALTTLLLAAAVWAFGRQERGRRVARRVNSAGGCPLMRCTFVVGVRTLSD